MIGQTRLDFSTGIKVIPLDKGNTKHRAFMFKAWIGSFKKSSQLPYELYPVIQQSLIERIVDRVNCQVHLAVNPTDHDQFFGFIVHENTNAVHYIYVKHSLRNTGIGTDLLEFANYENTTGKFYYTSSTPSGKPFLAHRGGIYKPNLVRKPLFKG